MASVSCAVYNAAAASFVMVNLASSWLCQVCSNLHCCARAVNSAHAKMCASLKVLQLIRNKLSAESNTLISGDRGMAKWTACIAREAE